MLTKHQLRTCALFLRNAAAAVQWVSMMLFGAGDSATASRLNDILKRLDDEAKAIDALIPTAPDQSGGRA